MARKNRSSFHRPDEIACIFTSCRPADGRFYDRMGLFGLWLDGHRRAVAEQIIQHQSRYFCIEVISYAITNSEIRQLLRARPDLARDLSPTELAERWLMLCPSLRTQSAAPDPPTKAEIRGITRSSKRISAIRRQLSDVSWWMRLLCQKTAQRFNRDDNTDGPFHRGRYRSLRLLDEFAVLAGLTSIDLSSIQLDDSDRLSADSFSAIARQLSVLASNVGIISAKEDGSTARGGVPVIASPVPGPTIGDQPANGVPADAAYSSPLVTGVLPVDSASPPQKMVNGHSVDDLQHQTIERNGLCLSAAVNFDRAESEALSLAHFHRGGTTTEANPRFSSPHINAAVVGLLHALRSALHPPATGSGGANNGEGQLVSEGQTASRGFAGGGLWRSGGSDGTPDHQGELPAPPPEYLHFLEGMAHLRRGDPEAAISPLLPAMLDVFRISSQRWMVVVGNFRELFRHLAGVPEHIDSYVSRSGERYFHIPCATRQLLMDCVAHLPDCMF